MAVDYYHDLKRDLLVYKPDDPARLVGLMPDARLVNGNHVAVPRTLYNSQLMRWLDLPVPPVMDDYDWPHRPGIKPLAHQKLMANFMALHPRCFNLSDMGTMKTRPLTGLDLPQGKPVTLAPGGYHVMTMGLKAPLKAGDVVTIQLVVEDAQGKRETVDVKAVARAN